MCPQSLMTEALHVRFHKNIYSTELSGSLIQVTNANAQRKCDTSAVQCSYIRALYSVV